jgi:hypothetical protein
MTLRLIAMPCIFSSQATKNRPALRLSGTKNPRFAIATLPRFSALDVTNFYMQLAIEKNPEHVLGIVKNISSRVKVFMSA